MHSYKNLSIKGMDGEKWKPVIDRIDFCGRYYVSNMGRIKTMFSGQGKIMKQQIGSKNGRYLLISFQKVKVYTRSVHRLVAKAFIPNPNNLPEVNHVGESGDKLDNRVCSLEWSTHADNIRHASEVLDVNGGLKHFRCKFKKQDVIDIFYSKKSNRALAKIYGVTSGVIYSIKNKKSYKTILKDHNIEGKIFNSQKGFTKKDILDIHGSECTYDEIADMYKISWSTIHIIKSGKKYAEITGGKKEKRRMASNEQVLYIRNSGKSTKELMKELGFSKPFINNIKAKRAYSWI